MAADQIAILDRFNSHIIRGKDKKVADIDRVATDGKVIESNVENMCEMIRVQLHKPPHNNPTVEAFKTLLTHLNAHYDMYCFLQKHVLESYLIRRKIMALLLDIRVKSSGQVGLVNESLCETKYSPYYTYRCSSSTDSPNSAGVSNNNTSPSQTPISFKTSKIIPKCPFPLNDLFPAIILALETEKDWNVLNLILRKLPSLLTSEALIHEIPQEYLKKFTSTVCNMIEDGNYYPSISNAPERLKKEVFQSNVFPILSNLVSYHKLIDSASQAALVTNLNVGIKNSQSRHQCITALALCVVEMPDIMIKQLPKLLSDLSKISQTVTIANPLLEFLSYATLDPRLYASFTQDQFMAIFAIVLPFTNPTKFSLYVVTMAFKVISMWFLKCRINFRKNFVNFIVKNLGINVIKPIRDSKDLREDNREEVCKRSGSISSESILRSDSQTNSNSSLNNSSPPANAASLHSNEKFYMELVESHMDFLARYSQGLCSTVPETPSGQDILLDKSQSSTWLVGKSLITITTSGCRQRTFVDGLCERCFRCCKSVGNNDSVSDDVFNSMKSDYQVNFMNNGRDFDYHTNPLNSLRHSNSTSNTTSNDSLYNSERNPISSRRRHQSAIVPNNSSRTASRNFLDDHHFTNSTCSSGDDYEDSFTCSCWCEGWAEIRIRRPSGTTCMISRLQNRLNVPSYPYNPFDMFPNDLSPMYPSRKSNKSETDADSGVVRGEDPLAGDSSDLNSSPLFRRPSSSPDVEQEENAVVTSPTDEKTLNSQESLEDSSNDTNSVKISRASSLGRGDSVKQSQFTRSSSFSWKSSSRNKKSEPTSPNSEANQKEVSSSIIASTPNAFQTAAAAIKATFKPIKKDLQLDLKSEPTENNHSSMKYNLSSTSSSSSLAATSTTSVAANSRTPPKTPLKLEGISESKPSDNVSQIYPRGRLATISVMSPAQVKPPSASLYKRSTSNQRITEVSNPRNDGIRPGFVFLQLQYDPSMKEINPLSKKDAKSAKNGRPILLPKDDVSIKTTLNILDKTLPHDQHRIGILYVEKDQTEDLHAILSNRSGSYRYTQFLRGVGNIILLKDVDPFKCYTGGLSNGGGDGKLAITWQDNLIQVIFHVSTFMPNNENDCDRNDKKRHIGNDNVCIIYNDSEQSINVANLKFGNFLLAAIVIDPLDFERNSVSVQFFQEGLSEIVERREPAVVSDSALPAYVRQLSLNLNVDGFSYLPQHESTEHGSSIRFQLYCKAEIH
ncbi:TSC complex subunit tuberin isoform X2 [Brevipalpus obovatus]|uniref:TSC complex subunit tuberin isoform X2 n=1 Tax=Brevipalpus obovatus TaxID=246614 RepID=UPI003D9F9DE9